MAAWSHAPFANEVENYIIQQIGFKFGFKEAVDGVFTAGGTEANLTALCTAIRKYFPAVKENGWRSISENPVLYTSKESHHSVLKAAVVTGLGKQAVRNIPSDVYLTMDIEELKQTIEEDLEDGNRPFMVVATAGTTGAGGFDDLIEIRKICTKYNLWMHVDAAYGGACAFSKDHRYLLGGIEKADSVTFDAHKWLSVPMGAGIFMTNHKNILTDTFQMNAQYMPKEAEGMNINDPYNHSIQWSRRFIGLKLYLALLVIGWEGYEQSISEDFRIGKLLKQNLEKSGWKIYNNTELPIICFNKSDNIEDSEWTKNIANKLVATRKIWISTFPVADKLCLRACITNYMTRDNEVTEIVSLINEAAQSS
jgi:glutamate/tyrosine decarboxylase-like PLP-dependent enzyme